MSNVPQTYVTTIPITDDTYRVASIGVNIRQARKECGLSQRQLAELLGYQSSTAISLIEDGKRHVSAQKLLNIAHITNKEIGWFYE